MSGDVVTLLDGDGSIGRLVRVAARFFADQGGRPVALVGGLAVMARLATMHRATTDVDTVVDQVGDPVLGAVADAPAVSTSYDGVTVDVMATSSLPPDAADLPDDEHHRLFVLAHRWALETAAPLTLVVHGVTDSEAELTVATSPALLACKLHAIADRRDARAGKRESDARDIFRLAELMVRSIGENPYRDAPFDLATLVGSGVQRWFVDEGLRTARLLTISASTGEAPVELTQLQALGRALTRMVSLP